MDRALLRLFMAGCFHYWDQLPDLARECYSRGASVAQLRGCVRHLVVFAGYGPCLAATLALHKAKLLPEDAPGKAAGPPGNAFELVYGGVTDRVRANMQAADPVLQEWIRRHLYGDVYSSPGLDLRQKQLLTCAFLAEAAMPDQLFGHALAGLRFGNSYSALEEAAAVACEMGPRQPAAKEVTLKAAVTTLGLAYAKYCKDMAGSPPACPKVDIVDPDTSICLPPLPPLVNPPPAQQQPLSQQPDAAAQGIRRQSTEEDPLAAAADVSVSISASQGGGLKPAGGSRSGTGGWGTSNLGRPSALAVDVIAARMAEQRERSGLFFAWDPLPPADEEQYALQDQPGYEEAEQGYDGSWRRRQRYSSEEQGGEQLGGAEEGVPLEGQV